MPLQLHRGREQTTVGYTVMQIIVLSGTKCLSLAHYVNIFGGWLKNFGPAQNILGPVKGQGISNASFY